MRQFGVAVIQQVQRLHALGFVGQVGRAMRRQDLRLDAGGVHQFQPSLDVGGRIRNRMPRDPGRRRHADARREAIAHEVAECLRNVMRMDIADHRTVPSPGPDRMAVCGRNGDPGTPRPAQELRPDRCAGRHRPRAAPTARCWSSSAPRAAGSPRCCAWWRGSSDPPPAGSCSAGATSRTSIRPSATSPWCSRTTRSIRT